MTQDFLSLMILMMDVNFASAFVEKIRLDGKPQGISFARIISVNSQRKVKKIMAGFSSIKCQMTGPLLEWCNVALVYFDMMAYFCIFKNN